MAGYSYPDITRSDVCVRAEGATLEEAFKSIALGAFDVVTDIGKIKRKTGKKISIKSEDLKSLLYDWIEYLIILFDSEHIVLSDFDIRVIKRGEKYSLEGTGCGEKIDRKRHEIKTHIKAVTYHLMEARKERNKWVLQAILDL